MTNRMIQSGKLKHLGGIILTVVFFLYLFVVYDANFPGPDEPIYLSYTASIVQDGDFNVINHTDPRYPFNLPSGKLGISKSYNLPDFHAHGGVTLWAPFYAYAKLVYYVADKLCLNGIVGYGVDRLARCAMSFSTVLFSFLTLLLTYRFSRIFFSKYVSIFSVLTVFIGTPFFYFTIQETGNANIVASLFSVISIWMCVYVINKKSAYWFLYGLFFSICLVAKVDIWFQLFFLLILFVYLVILKKVQWFNGISFLLGLIPVAALKIINDYIKYGTFHVGEVGSLNFNDNYLIELLFSSYRGFLYTSPIFYFCLLGFILAGVNLFKGLRSAKNNNNINTLKMNDLFLVILASCLFIKVFVFSYNYAWGGGTCGARILLTEFPIFVLLLARVLRGQKKYVLYIFGTISVLFVLWNLLVVSEFITRLDFSYISRTPGLMARIKAISDIFASVLFQIRDLEIKLKSALPLFLFFSITVIWIMKRWKTPVSPSFWYIKNGSWCNLNKFFIIFTGYLCLIYLFFTISNIYNNRIKVERLKAQGFFSNVEILSSNEFEKRENIGAMNEMIEFYTLKGNMKKVARIQKHKIKTYPTL
ncbi:MAG: hypothetical protein NT014_06545 [Candidatus Omnitrophica bacterium]|nr:hypothetical protein [Candidatus Omnitrophota bacterium]